MSDYENDTAITCRWTILDLLYRRWGDNTTREVSLWPHAPPHVEIGHHRDFSDSTYKRFLVDANVVASLVAERLLEGKKEWGYTSKHTLFISEAGALAISAKWEAMGGADFYGHGKSGVPPAEDVLRREVTR